MENNQNLENTTAETNGSSTTTETTPTADKSSQTQATTEQNTQVEQNNFEFTDSQDKELEKEKQERDKARDAEMARKRRERELQAKLTKERETARLQAIKDATGGVNPYTNEPIATKHDVDKFLEMKEIEKNGGDPLADYHKVVSKKANEETERIQRQEQQESFLNNDFDDFMQKYPNVKIQELIANQDFMNYADKRIGKEPLSSLYAGYKALVDRYEKQAKERAEKMYANKMASPGSLSTTATPPPTKSISQMSDAEFEAFQNKLKNRN